MSGGKLQLVAQHSIETVFLTGNPTITMFKMVYRRHTNFSVTQIDNNVPTINKFGSEGLYSLDRKGDCISKVNIQFDIGDFDVKYINPINKYVLEVLDKYDIVWNNSYDASFNIIPNIYTTILKPIIYDQIDDYVVDYNNSFRFISDANSAISEYNTINDSLYNTILYKTNNILNDVSFYDADERDSIYNYINLIKKLLSGNQYRDYLNFVVNNIIVGDHGVYPGSIISNVSGIFQD